MIVREAIVADPRVLAASAPAREAAELLARPHVRSALVVEGDLLVGCVTRETIVEAVAQERDLRSLTAGDLASPDVTTISPDASLDEALRLMVERDLDRIAVTDGDRLVGVLPRESILRRIAEDDDASSDGRGPLAPA